MEKNSGIIRTSRLSKTLFICSWVLVAVGFVMTVWLNNAPYGFVPFILLSFTICSARHVVIRAVILALTLASVGVGFWYDWDAAFIHLSTLNLLPFDVAIVESVVAGLAWIIVHRISKKRRLKSDTAI